MSNSRHAAQGAPLSQERYMSSPEYVELRGISGNAVTTKAALMAHPEKRSLLFFLQAMSLKPGGLKTFCRNFLAMFPKRVGSATMHRAGMKPGKSYSLAIATQIEAELETDRHNRRLAQDSALAEDDGEDDLQSASTPRLSEAELKTLCSVDYWHNHCQHKLAKLEGFIIELCINPKLYFAAPGETEDCEALEKITVAECFQEQSNGATYDSSELPYFDNIIGALFEYKEHYEQTARAGFVMTEIGGNVFEVLDVGLLTGKMVVVEGQSRIGKTTAAEAWCELHLGEARFVSLSGITHKTGLFRALAKVLGIGSSYARSSTEMQTRIEAVLQQSRLMIVIDEAHHLFSASERVYSRPELVDWLNTALYNHGIPTGLLCTPQFALRMARAEKQTTWNADQLRGRIKRFCRLPDRPSDKDVLAVARKLLPDGCADSIKLLVGYALSSKLPLPALVDALDEAKLLARRESRDKITFADLDRAIFQYSAESAKAMARAFDSELANKRGGRKPASAQAQETSLARPLQAPAQAQPGATRRGTNLAANRPLGLDRSRADLEAV